MTEHYYKGNKIVEYCPNDFVGFYFNEDLDILTVRGTSLKQVQKELDIFDPNPGSKMP